MAKNGNICGNTPNETKISEVNFDNSTDQLFKLFSDRVKDHDSNGRIFGKKLTDNVLGRMSTAQLKWRSAIDEGSEHNFNILDEYDSIFSQSLASSIQSVMNNVTVNVDMTKIEIAPGLWIELTIASIVLLLPCVILSFILTAKNENWL